MARIFYDITTGRIHGVHPGVFDGHLPENTTFLEVSGSPDTIVWPATNTGIRSERTSLVQNNVLVARVTEIPPEDDIILALRELADEIGLEAKSKIEDRFGRRRA